MGNDFWVAFREFKSFGIEYGRDQSAGWSGEVRFPRLRRAAACSALATRSARWRRRWPRRNANWRTLSNR
jgi:hypothetical protein